MSYGRKIVLHCPRGYDPRLDAMIEQFILDGVVFVGIVGKDCAKIEDIIDELVTGDASDANRFILTSSHPDESLEKAIQFAQSLTEEYAGEAQIVEL